MTHGPPEHPKRELLLDPRVPIRDSMALVFENPSLPLDVDVGCGKGRFLAARAAANRQTNHVGIERIPTRLLKVGRKCARLGLRNVALLHAEAAHAIGHLMPPEGVRTYYVFFPDPWPKRRHHRRRLFTADLLTSLYRTMEPGGTLHVATDDMEYHAAILGLFGNDARFVPVDPLVPSEPEQTDFERIFLSKGVVIGRCSYRRA